MCTMLFESVGDSLLVWHAFVLERLHGARAEFWRRVVARCSAEQRVCLHGQFARFQIGWPRNMSASSVRLLVELFAARAEQLAAQLAARVEPDGAELSALDWFLAHLCRMTAQDDFATTRASALAGVDWGAALLACQRLLRALAPQPPLQRQPRPQPDNALYGLRQALVNLVANLAFRSPACQRQAAHADLVPLLLGTSSFHLAQGSSIVPEPHFCAIFPLYWQSICMLVNNTQFIRISLGSIC